MEENKKNKFQNIPDKWVEEMTNVYFPISGNTVLHQSLGGGIFELYQGSGPDKRIGLKRIGDKFEFSQKIYDLGCDDLMETIQRTWNSNKFVNEDRNLGIIFSGNKGAGKTFAARILCNKLEIPVIVVSNIKDGMVEFLQSLNFEAIVFIDEAEKIFKKGEDDEILLRIVDGSYNKSRKLYILTMNKLDINENLIGRPGRVRYIKQFGNLTEKAVNDYIDDNLDDKSKKKEILELVDLLEISTIDILRNIVDEVNIHGEITENSYLNIPKARYIFDVLKFDEILESEEKEIRQLFKSINNLESWLKEIKEGEKTNEDWLYDKYGCYQIKLTTQFSTMFRGTETNYGEVVENIDDDGFFRIRSRYNDGEDYLCRIIFQRTNPSLYRGGLLI